MRVGSIVTTLNSTYKPYANRSRAGGECIKRGIISLSHQIYSVTLYIIVCIERALKPRLPDPRCEPALTYKYEAFTINLQYDIGHRQSNIQSIVLICAYTALPPVLNLRLNLSLISCSPTEANRARLSEPHHGAYNVRCHELALRLDLRRTKKQDST